MNESNPLISGHWPLGSTVHWYLYADAGSWVNEPITRGIQSWTAAADIHIVRVDDSSLANVLVGFVPDLSQDATVSQDPSQIQAWLDGRELGLTDMPQGIVDPSVTRLTMRLNVQALGGWTTQKLEDVARHEFGHALGFNHSPPGIPSCMEATLDQRISVQTPYDTVIAQVIYGSPTSVPEPAS